MIPGISSFTYGWAVGVDQDLPIAPMTEADLVRKLHVFGIKCLQLGDNLPVHSFSKTRLDSLRKVTQENSIRLEVGAKELTAEKLTHYISLAGSLQAPLLRFVIDGPRYEPSVQAVATIIKEAVPKLVMEEITLGIENHDRFKAKELVSLMDAVDSDRVGICLDCVNSMGAGEGLEYVSDLLAPYTVNLHIKDFIVTRLPHKMGFTITGAPAGMGMTNVPMIMEKLSRYDRCQSAILEQWVPYENNLPQTIATEKLWAEQSIDYLKTLPYFEF